MELDQNVRVNICFCDSAAPSYATGNEGFSGYVKATIGHTIHLNCSVDGQPAVNVLWMMNGEPISNLLQQFLVMKLPFSLSKELDILCDI